MEKKKKKNIKETGCERVGSEYGNEPWGLVMTKF